MRDSDEVATRSQRAIRRDFRALGRPVKGSGAQVVFSLSFQLQKKVREKQKQPADQYLASSLVSPAEFWVSDHGLVYMTSPAGERQGMLVSKAEKDLCTGISRAF